MGSHMNPHLLGWRRRPQHWLLVVLLGIPFGRISAADLELAAQDPVLQVGKGPRGIAAGDLDRDGKSDLVVCNGLAPYGISVLKNLGDGRFTASVDHPSDPEPYEIALADVNGDGWLDALVACLPVGILNVYLNDGKGGFLPRTNHPIDNGCQALVVADVNGDRHLDVVAGIFAGGTILLGKGDGTFPTKIEQSAGGGINSVAVGDVTGDGIPDLIADGTRLLVGAGNGRFAKERIVAPRSRQVALADLNGDKILDLVTIGLRTDGSNSVATFLNNRKGEFTLVSSHPVGRMMTQPTVVDIDGDGRLDVCVSSVHESVVVVLLGQAAGRLAPPISYPTGKAPNAQVVADLFGDSKAEVATVGFKTHGVSLLQHRPIPLPPAVEITAEPFADRIIRVSWTGPKVMSNWSQAAIYDVEMAPGADSASGTWSTVAQQVKRVTPEQLEHLDIPDLKPGSAHRLRVRARDGLGRPGAWSQVATVTLPTSDHTPPAPITDLHVTGRDATLVVLRWTAPGDDGTFGTASAYDLRSSTSPITGETFDQATKIPTRPPEPAGTQEVITVTRLAPGQPHHFAVRAVDEAGNVSALVKPLETKTRPIDAIAPDAVRDLRLVSAIGDTAVLRWMASGNDGMLGQATGYVVRFSTSPITDDATFMAATAADGLSAPQMAGTTDEATLNRLVAGTRYHVAVRAVDEAGNVSPLSPAFSFVAGTGAGDPGSPTASSAGRWILAVLGVLVGLLALYGVGRWMLQRPPDPAARS